MCVNEAPNPGAARGRFLLHRRFGAATEKGLLRAALKFAAESGARGGRSLALPAARNGCAAARTVNVQKVESRPSRSLITAEQCALESRAA